jgi:glycosyltransferase involved in cell wall biosynthesis
MHRSGTSVVTRIFNLLGAAVPKTLMPATSENPSGYWESVRIAHFNNRLLESAQTSWKNDSPVPDQWFRDDARIADRLEARSILEDEFGEAQTFVLKCPRICLLLPFWKQVLLESGIKPYAVLVVRDPAEVARSLSTRAISPASRPAAITLPEHALLLWLRYVLDAERYSRDLPRFVVEYSDLVHDWRTAFKPVLEMTEPFSPENYAIPYDAIDELFHSHLLRKKETPSVQASEMPAAAMTDPLRKLIGIIKKHDRFTIRHCDLWAHEFERIRTHYAPLRNQDAGEGDQNTWTREVLNGLIQVNSRNGLESRVSRRMPKILFLTGVSPANVGRVFRIQHVAWALESLGWRTEQHQIDDPSVLGCLDASDLVVVFRTKWDSNLAEVRKVCSSRRIPLVYDIDDPIFVPEIMTPDYFDFLDLLAETKKQEWISKAEANKKALENCDAAILTTDPLARMASTYCHQTYVLPNMLDASMAALAESARANPKPSDSDGKLRLGFAGGNPTHQENFRVIVPALIRILNDHPEAVLTIVGPLLITSFTGLQQFSGRIELRPRVPLSEVFSEINRFDINLAPLQTGNPFCESKSELRCVFAGAVSVPTVASPSLPLQRFIVDGKSGFLASNTEEWINSLNTLLENPGLLTRMGNSCRIHTMARFGPEACIAQTRGVYSKILIPLCE